MHLPVLSGHQGRRELRRVSLPGLPHYKKEKGLAWEKAVPAALNRNLDVFGKVLKDEGIAKEVRGERKDTEAEDSADSDESMEDEDDEEEDEEAYKPIFP